MGRCGRTHVVQDTDQWRALVNTVMNLRVEKKRGGEGGKEFLEWLSNH
jgi:hypothetical protein